MCAGGRLFTGWAVSETSQSALMVFLFTDIAGSVDLKARLGDSEAARLISRHDELFRRTISLAASGKLVQDTGDGFLAEFATASDAVQTALRFQHAIHTEPWGDDAILVRAGVHLGEVAPTGDATGGEPKLIGLAIDIAARLMGLAIPGQILMSRAAFDAARQYVREHPGIDSSEPSPELRWMAHGPYLFKGAEEPMDVFEVGAEDVAELKAPPNSEKAKRAILPGEEDLFGWRPASGRTIPRRDNWILERRIGAGGFGEVWVASHRKVGTPRVFKFCFDAEHLRSLKREITLFRLLREALRDRPDIAKLHDIQVDKPPFYLESEFTQLGNLADWAEAQGGIDQLPLTTRLDLVAGACDAVAAAHSVGVLHKDIKPPNILIYETADGSPCPRLCDFGISILTDRSQLERHDITISGFTEVLPDGADSSQTGTRMYVPPETLMGEPFTIQGDVYALGVLLYQMVAGDLKRPLAPGWEADVADPLLREDIACAAAGRSDERLGSASELAQRLRTLDRRRRARRRRYAARAAVTVSAILMGLLVLVGAGYVYERGQRERINDALAEAEWNRELAEWESYVANIYAADVAVSNDELSKARRRLAATPKHLRNWEYDHLLVRTDLSLATLRGHDGRVRSIAFSSDGSRLASASSDGTIKVWDAVTGEQSLSLPASYVERIAFSPDGSSLALMHYKTIQLWKVAADQEPIDLGGHNRQVLSVAFSPDGARLASASMDRTIKFWDTETGKELTSHTLPTEDFLSWTWSVVLSPDAQRVALVDRNHEIEIWDAATGEKLHRLVGHQDDVSSTVFSQDGRRLASVSGDETIKIWDVETGKELLTFSREDAAVSSSTTTDPPPETSYVTTWAASFSPDGARFASATLENKIRLWDTTTGKELGALRGHEDYVRSIAFSPEGALLATGSADKTIKFWDIDTGEEPTVVHDHEDDVRSVAFSPDSARLATCSRSTVTLWDVVTGAELISLHAHEGEVHQVVFSADGAQLASVSDRRVILWDADTGQKLTTVARSDQAPLRSVALSPGGGRLVAASRDSIRFYDATTGKELTRIELGDRHSRGLSPFGPMALSPDGRRLASGGNPIRVWDASTGAQELALTGHDDYVTAIVFSPDGARLASAATFDNTVRLWNVDTGKELMILHGANVSSVAFSRDGARLASAGDETVRVWDVKTGAELITLPHDADVRSVAFSPDGTRLASTSSDGTVRLWDTVPRSQRLAEKRAVMRATASVRSLVDRLVEDLVEPMQVVDAIRNDDTLTDAGRKAALNLVLAGMAPNPQGMESIWSLGGYYRGIAFDDRGGVFYAASISDEVAVLDLGGKSIRRFEVRFEAENIRTANLLDHTESELLVLSEHAVLAYDSTGGLIWSYRRDERSIDVWAGDLDGAGLDEILIAYLQGAVHVLDHRGELLWKNTNLGRVRNVCAGDINDDGEMEVVVTASGQVHVFDAHGAKLRDFQPPCRARLVRAPKLQTDDVAILVTGAETETDRELLLGLGPGGEVKWTREVSSAAVFLAVAEQRPWLAVGARSGSVTVHDIRTGKVLARVEGQGSVGQIAWIEHDPDESPLLVVATGRAIHAFRVNETQTAD